MFDDDSHIRPERVDERLTNLAGENVNGPDTPTRRIIENIQAEFLEATKPRPVVSRPSDMPQPPNDQEKLTPLIISNRVRTFSDLPLDVFLEVASEVSPLDLIHLSRTSKTLRRVLMSKKNCMVWRDALSEVPELPPCPSDMAEPLYAALVFGQNCFGCGASDAYWVDYALRLRMCERCYKANVVIGTHVFKPVPQHCRDMIRDVVLMLVPSANTFEFSEPTPSFDPVNPLTHHIEDFYFKPELEAMLRFFWPLPSAEDIAALQPLVRTRVNYVMTRQAYAVLLHAWDNYCFEPTAGEDSFVDIKSSLERPAFSQLRGRDWDSSALYSDPAFTAYLKGEDDTPELDPDKPKPKPAKQLAMERSAFERREQVERVARARARVTQVAVWQREIMQLPALARIPPAELPNVYASSRMWDRYIYASVARHPFDLLDPFWAAERDPHELAQRAARSMAEYPGKVMRSLADDVERFEAEDAQGVESKGNANSQNGKGAKGTKKKQEGRRGGAKQDPKDVLLRRTALFQCAECGENALPYPEINLHWQKKHPKKSVWRGDRTETVYRAKIWEEGVRAGEKVFAELVRQGLPRNQRNMPWLDELVRQGRVFCACGDPDMVMPPEELSWATLVDHVYSNLRDNALRTKTATSSRNSKASTKNAAVWLNDHDLASCIKYLPDGADTAEASKRVTADQCDRERIDVLIGQCTKTSSLACRLCDALTGTPDFQKDDTLFLSERADAVVYHMRAKHGKDFDEKDIVCWDLSILDKSPAP